MRLSAYDKWLIEGDERDDYIVAYDRWGNAIRKCDGDRYYKTEDEEYVREDEIKEYMEDISYGLKTIDEWEDC